MAYRSTITVLSVPLFAAPLVLLASGSVQAATPTYYNDEATFLTDITENVLDDYTNPGYMPNQSDVQMSSVLGETDYRATGFLNSNFVTGNGTYCSGCNGSFELSFQTTTVGEPEGVNGVGFTIFSHDVLMPYYAYITFADGTTEDVLLPPQDNFWGVVAPERVERIHIGFSGGASAVVGYFEMDRLIVGDGFDETPCGDGIPTEDEECDTAGNSATCDANCTLALCGDGTFNDLAGEACDTGGVSPTCNADCTAPFCGDELVNALAGEECDDGVETATCNSDCTVPECGDDVINELAGEICDDGGQSPACDNDCTLVECGDGLENNLAGEFCDDGNLVDGDGCSATCTNEEVEDEGGNDSSGGGSSSEGGGTTTATSADSGGSGESGIGEDSTEDGGTAVDGTDEGNSATASMTDGETITASASDSNGESSSGTDSGGANDDDSGGCGCTTSDDQGRDALWSVMVVLGMGALRRRRRH